MSNYIDKYQKRRLITSYVSVTVSISLVLLLMGLLGLLVFNASKLANHFKEKIAISIYLKEDASQTEIQSLQRKFSMSSYVKNSEFISKDEAAIKRVRSFRQGKLPRGVADWPNSQRHRDLFLSD